MSETVAKYGVLSSSAENFAIVAGTIQEELHNLETSLQNSLASWESDARDAYWVNKSKWDAAAADMQNVVKRLGLAIGTAHDNYVMADKYGVNIFD